MSASRPDATLKGPTGSSVWADWVWLGVGPPRAERDVYHYIRLLDAAGCGILSQTYIMHL